MANPATLATGAIGGTAAGAVTSGIGSLFQGSAQAGMYNYQAGVAQANATLAGRDAIYATQSGEVQAQQAGLKTAAEVGATKTRLAAGNVDTGSGSASQVLSSETSIGQENEAVIRANAAKQAYGYNVKQAEDVSQASAYQTAAQTSKTAADIGLVSSLVGGAGSVSSKWLQYGQSFGS